MDADAALDKALDDVDPLDLDLSGVELLECSRTWLVEAAAVARRFGVDADEPAVAGPLAEVAYAERQFAAIGGQATTVTLVYARKRAVDSFRAAIATNAAARVRQPRRPSARAVGLQARPRERRPGCRRTASRAGPARPRRADDEDVAAAAAAVA